jgi:hypothetical protein
MTADEAHRLVRIPRAEAPTNNTTPRANSMPPRVLPSMLRSPRLVVGDDCEDGEKQHRLPVEDLARQQQDVDVHRDEATGYQPPGAPTDEHERSSELEGDREQGKSGGQCRRLDDQETIGCQEPSGDQAVLADDRRLDRNVGRPVGSAEHDLADAGVQVRRR